jgi:putative DNA primase/helicase
MSDKEIKGWSDLPEEDRKAALDDAGVFEGLKSAYPDADFSERDKLMEKYAVKLKCNYCEAVTDANFLTGLPDLCPQCHRKLNVPISPAAAAEWLMNHYEFATTRDLDEVLMVYDDKKGIWDKEKATSIIEEEGKVLLGEKLKMQDVTNITLHIRAKTFVDRSVLATAIRSNDSGIIINLRNTVIYIKWGSNLFSIEIQEHKPENYFLACLPIDFDPNASFPQHIMDFLQMISDGDVFKFITLNEGVAWPLLPGYPIEQSLALVGSGGNGKTTYLTTIVQALYGSENMASITLQQLSAAAQQQPFLISQLYGKLLNIADDLPKKPVIDVDYFKKLTGGSPVEGERKFGSRFGFINSAKFYFTANQMPPVNEETYAYWRRFCFLEFNKKIDSPRPKEEILAEFKAELPGYFNILLGFVMPLMFGKTSFTFADSPEITESIYMKNANSAAVFAEKMVVENSDAITPKADLYETYKKWAETHNLLEVSEKRFWITIKSAHPQALEVQKQVQGKHLRYIQGLQITPVEDEIQDQNEEGEEREKQKRLMEYIDALNNNTSNTNITNIFPLLNTYKEYINIIDSISKNHGYVGNPVNPVQDPKNLLDNSTKISTQPSENLVIPVQGNQDSVLQKNETAPENPANPSAPQTSPSCTLGRRRTQLRPDFSPF